MEARVTTFAFLLLANTISKWYQVTPNLIASFPIPRLRLTAAVWRPRRVRRWRLVGHSQETVAGRLQPCAGLRAWTSVRPAALSVRSGALGIGQNAAADRDTGEDLVPEPTLQDETQADSAARGGRDERYETGARASAGPWGWILWAYGAGRSGGWCWGANGLRWRRIGSGTAEHVPTSGKHNKPNKIHLHLDCKGTWRSFTIRFRALSDGRMWCICLECCRILPDRFRIFNFLIQCCRQNIISLFI